jgi:aminoglycoside phosphotransferase family enzyme/predicted kinase
LQTDLAEAILTQNSIIQSLLTPSFYSHSVEVITTIETHSSIIFVTGDFAYKLKKSVNFGFLNFSSLTLREKFSTLEITLNKRTAPDIYLSVSPVWQTTTQPLAYTLIPQASQPVEYLVKMQQFDPNKVLGAYLKNNSLSEQQVTQLTRNIVQLHQEAETVSNTIELGDPDNLIQPMLENFSTLFKSFQHPDLQYRLKQLSQWTLLTHQQLKPHLLRRKQQGFIRACHGDLHLDNIALIQEIPTLFDGIEFNEQFRWIDPLNDLSFLLIDLEFNQQEDIAHQILNDYMNQTGDYEALPLLIFYKVYRAMVRCKITTLRAFQLPKTETIALQSLQAQSHKFLSQAESFAYTETTPQLILMQGVSGSGKSYFAKQLVTQFHFMSISSDIERKRLYHISPLTRMPNSEKQHLYSDQMSRTTYQQLLKKTQVMLESGMSVVVDATFLEHSHRQPFIELAQSMGISIGIFMILADLDTLKNAITHRNNTKTDPSDATIEVMQQQLEYNAPPATNQSVWQQKAGTDFANKEFKSWLNQL